MAKEWTDEEVKSEIQAAIGILKEDAILKAIKEGKNTNPNPPPGGANNDPNSGKKKGSLWWGDVE